MLTITSFHQTDCKNTDKIKKYKIFLKKLKNSIILPGHARPFHDN